MKQPKDHIRDLSEIRSMMERSTKFLSLSGWSGIMAGTYAMAGSYVAREVLGFSPDRLLYDVSNEGYKSTLANVISLAIVILILAIGTAIFFSKGKASKRNEKLWNTTSRRLLVNMAVPLAVGGIFVLILISNGLVGLIAPCTLIFYGLSLYNAGKFTFGEVKAMGLIQVGLGLLNACFINYGLIFWALGFGLVHIVYGLYLHLKYER